VARKLAITIALLVAGAITGLVLGNALVPEIRTAARHARWTSLGSPPEPVETIAGEAPCGRGYSIVVRTSSGTTYQSCQGAWSDPGALASSMALLAPCRGDPPTQYNPGFDQLPQPVKACGMVYSTEWSVSERVFVILDDNSVWAWDFTFGPGIYLGYWSAGLVVGLAVAAILSVRLWRKG
jgi:hypothetical protein